MITLGAVAGARFANTTPRTLLGYLGAAFGSFAVAIAVASRASRWSSPACLPLPIADVVVAYSPGAQDTMMVLALALHLDPVFVGAHHLARFMVVTCLDRAHRATVGSAGPRAGASAGGRRDAGHVRGLRA